LDQDLFAWESAKLCYAYNKALWAVEIQSLEDKGMDTEGDHHYTILDEIKDYYPNLFIRNVQDSTEKDWAPKYGYHMNKPGKGMIMDNLKSALREEAYYERDFQSTMEFRWFETKPTGKLGAIDGKNDDLVIVSAGANWLSSSYMPAPKLIPYIEPGDRKPLSKTIVGEATI